MAKSIFFLFFVCLSTEAALESALFLPDCLVLPAQMNFLFNLSSPANLLLRPDQTTVWFLPTGLAFPSFHCASKASFVRCWKERVPGEYGTKKGLVRYGVYRIKKSFYEKKAW